MRLTTRSMLCGAGLSLLSCGSESNSVLVDVANLPALTTTLSVNATLAGKVAAMTDTLNVPLAQNQFGVQFPQDATGHAVINVQAIDGDSCLRGTGSAAVDLPLTYMETTASITAQSPRKCGSLMPCAANTACQITPAQSNAIQSIWTLTPSNIWAVGNGGMILHYDGTSWSVVAPPSGFASTLFGVWASAPNDIWAVGQTAYTLHYDGNTWTQVPNAYSANLYGVWGVSSSDIWAVGDPPTAGAQGLFLHYDGASWQSITTAGSARFNAVWADNSSGTNFVYACGLSGLLVRYDPTQTPAWSLISSPTSNNLHAIWGTPSHVVFAAGDSGTIIRIRYGIDSGWSMLSNSGSYSLYGLSGDGSTVVYAVGSSGTMLRADAPYDTFKPQTSGISSTLYTANYGKNGLTWIGGLVGYLGFIDLRP